MLRQVDIEIKQGKAKVETLELSTKESEEFERIVRKSCRSTSLKRHYSD